MKKKRRTLHTYSLPANTRKIRVWGAGQKNIWKLSPRPNYGGEWTKNFGDGPRTYRYEYQGAWRRIQVKRTDGWHSFSKWVHDPYNRFFMGERRRP